MHEIETYAIMDDAGVIVRVYETSNGITGVERAMLNENVIGKIQPVPNGFEGHERNHKDEFDSGWNLRPLKDRVVDGFVTLSKDMTVDETTDEVRRKTFKEMLETDVIALSFEEKYDEENDSIVKKPWTEIIADSGATYENWLDTVVRPARNQKLLLVDTVYCNPERWWKYTEAEKTVWSEYKQMLRDMPSKTLEVVDDPALLPWPEAPEGITI